MTALARWPHLETLLLAYFHQDFDLEYDGTPEGTIDGFGQDEEVEYVRRAAAEARSLAVSESDEALRQRMTEAQVAYAYWADGWTDAAWLEFVASRLEASVRRRADH
ncbi:contact-dependent growth inhibition system immunity protein [Actinomycetospora termitidis]|uniref:Contact-dependent growth inhibition system immunity protein n=1 Tax=Actinomycetospora termitidis TaxID=3053470 RepID=A0ABT7MIY6_9PSEU|nr:contact-dependent growth inhibition system immunity protein [Actinomycetospora sp. Odt1-22]MDL5160169.1 contact-dependent growth inhibition system immunity protein [Actinomycetospora sp. Odt1-22]